MGGIFGVSPYLRDFPRMGFEGFATSFVMEVFLVNLPHP
jgi:hypothetical protein